MDLAIDFIIRFFGGLFIGFFIGLSGIGGGVLVMPLLTVVLGLAPTTAVGTASLFTLLAKIHAGYEHFRHKTVEWKTTLLFLCGAMPSTIVSSTLINSYATKLKTESLEALSRFEGIMNALIIGVMILSLVFLLIDKLKKPSAVSSSPKKSAIIPGLFFGCLIGTLIGATSIGGGVILVPILILFFGLSANKTVGTSIIIALALTLATTLIYGKSGRIDFFTSLVMWAGSIAGVFYGSRMCAKMPEKHLKPIIVALVIFSSILMLFKRH